jgi:hypothetical protein
MSISCEKSYTFLTFLFIHFPPSQSYTDCSSNDFYARSSYNHTYTIIHSVAPLMFKIQMYTVCVYSRVFY